MFHSFFKGTDSCSDDLTLRYTMEVLITSMVFSLVIAQDFSSYTACPLPCQCTFDFMKSQPTVQVICSIGALGQNNFNFSGLETNVTSILKIDCSPLLFSYLENNIFIHLYSFISIEITHCQFDKIDALSLFGLTALEELYIESARDLQIYESAFFNTPNLRRLSIVKSGLTKVPPLIGLSRIEYVNFTSNNIQSFCDSGVVCLNYTFERLNILILNFNDIQVINISLSQTIPNVKNLSIANNTIEYIISNSFKNLKDLEYLDLSSNRLTVLSDDLLRDNLLLKVLNLKWNPISNIPDGFFNSTKRIEVLDLISTDVGDSVWNRIKYLESLCVLQLGNASIKTLSYDYMKNFKKMQYLDISKNQIQNIPNYTFFNQQQLETLYLSYNKIRIIEMNSFQGMLSLKTLDLAGNMISQIHPDAFSNVVQLFVLNLSRNELTVIPDLHNLNNLYALDLRHNSIDIIECTSFRGLRNLAGVNLSWNRLTFILQCLFDQVWNLELLVLSHNNITFNQTYPFKSLIKLKWLILDHNNIEDISQIFANIPGLTELDVSFNRITGPLHGGHFDTLNELQELHASNNNISGILANTFSNHPYMRFIDLRYNSISTLLPTNRIFGYVRLPPSIYIGGNGFICDCNLAWMRKCIDKWLDSCRSLKVAEFEYIFCYRGYRTKPYTLLKNVNVENMLCEYENPCDQMCDCCHEQSCRCRRPCPQNCTCLMSYDHNNGVVSCSNQNLTDIKQAVPQIAKIFYLDGNKLHFLNSSVFYYLFQLDALYLNSSQVSNIQSRCFVNLNVLTNLYLNDNELTEILSDMFTGLPSLKLLNLEHNKIEFVENDAFSASPNLQELHLANNRLTALSTSVFVSFIHLRYLSLSFNPWSCDCNVLKELQDLTYDFADVILDRKAMYCYVNNSRNVSLQAGEILKLGDIDMDILCPNDTAIYTTVEKLTDDFNHIEIRALVTVLVLLIIIIIITAVIYINRQLIQVIIYNKFRIRLFNEKPDINKLYDAFVSYSHKDEDFVVHELVPRLENSGYKLCVHFRDFPIGACIADTIIESIDNSKRTIMVVSNNFVESEWCQYEFKTAHHSVLQEKSQKIIMILMEALDSLKLDHDLKLYMKTKTYLRREDPWFWKKIVFAMPNITKNNDQILNDLNKLPVHVEDNVKKEVLFQKNIC